MAPWLRYLIAFVVACHGLIYIPILFIPDMRKEWQGRSWLPGGALTGDGLRTLAAVLHVSAGIAAVACAVAIAFAPAFPGWWRLLAIAGGALSLAAFTVFWDGQTGGIGAVISVILPVIAIAFPNAFD